MNRFHLFFMFLSALLSSALHYTGNGEGKIEHEIKKIIYVEESSEKLSAEKGKQAEEEKLEITSFDVEKAPLVGEEKESQTEM